MATKTKNTTKKSVVSNSKNIQKIDSYKAHSGSGSCCLVRGMVGFYGCYVSGITRLVNPIFSLFIRVWLARIFWYSGMAKISDWNSTLELFKNEYKVPDISPIFAAYSSAGFELVCSALLVLGFMSRLAVLPLIAMSLVIHFTYNSSADPLYWAMLLGYIFCYGPGCISVDSIIKRKCCLSKCDQGVCDTNCTICGCSPCKCGR